MGIMCLIICTTFVFLIILIWRWSQYWLLLKCYYQPLVLYSCCLDLKLFYSLWLKFLILSFFLPQNRAKVLWCRHTWTTSIIMCWFICFDCHFFWLLSILMDFLFLQCYYQTLLLYSGVLILSYFIPCDWSFWYFLFFFLRIGPKYQKLQSQGIT